VKDILAQLTSRAREINQFLEESRKERQNLLRHLDYLDRGISTAELDLDHVKRAIEIFDNSEDSTMSLASENPVAHGNDMRDDPACAPVYRPAVD
jgi:hypothetical protein